MKRTLSASARFVAAASVVACCHGAEPSDEGPAAYPAGVLPAAASGADDEPVAPTPPMPGEASLEKGVAAAVGMFGARQLGIRLLSDEAADREVAAAKVLVDRGETDAALARAWSVVEAAPDHVEARVVLAGAYQLAGRSDAALEHIDVALGLDPSSVGAWMTRGAVLFSLERYSDAIAATEKVLEAQPKHVGALVNLAGIAAKSGDTRREIDALERLLVEVPADLRPPLRLARLHLARGELDVAHRYARRVFERDAEDAEAHMILALVAFQRDDSPAAMDHAHIAGRLDADLVEEASEIFRAAFYIRVAAAMLCRVGARPWKPEQIEPVLAELRAEGLVNTSDFYRIDEQFRDSVETNERVARAAGRCPARGVEGDPSPGAPP